VSIAGKYRVLYFTFIIAALSARVFPAGFELGLYGGAGRASMGSYNDAINAANSSNISLGMASNLKNQNIYFAPEITAAYNFGTIGIYLKNTVLLLKDNNSKALWPNGVKGEKISGDFSAIYTGAGVTYNLVFRHFGS